MTTDLQIGVPTGIFTDPASDMCISGQECSTSEIIKDTTPNKLKDSKIRVGMARIAILD